MSMLPPSDGDLVDSTCPDRRSAEKSALVPFPPPAASTPRRRREVVRTTALDTWIDTIRDTFVALDVAAEPTHFTGTVHTRQFAHLMAADVTATSQTFRRTPRLTNLHPRELMQIGMVVAGEGQLIQDGRTCTLGPGDFASTRVRDRSPGTCIRNGTCACLLGRARRCRSPKASRRS